LSVKTPLQLGSLLSVWSIKHSLMVPAVVLLSKQGNNHVSSDSMFVFLLHTYSWEWTADPDNFFTHKLNDELGTLIYETGSVGTESLLTVQAWHVYNIDLFIRVVLCCYGPF